MILPILATHDLGFKSGYEKWPEKLWILIKYFFLFKDAEADAGRIGVLIVFAGMLGSVICGVILDKFHRFKWVFFLP